jgi:hypothetical protein
MNLENVIGFWAYDAVDKPYGPFDCHEMLRWCYSSETWFLERTYEYQLTALFQDILEFGGDRKEWLNMKVRGMERNGAYFVNAGNDLDDDPIRLGREFVTLLPISRRYLSDHPVRRLPLLPTLDEL